MIVAIVSVLVVSLLISFFIWKHRKVKKLKSIRDDFDITTPEGRWLASAYNKKIDELNGYGIFTTKKH